MWIDVEIILKLNGIGNTEIKVKIHRKKVLKSENDAIKASCDFEETYAVEWSPQTFL